MDLLRIIKRFRSDKDPDLQTFEGKNLSTFSKEDLITVAKAIKLQLDDVLVLLDIDDTRENVCKIVSFALEQTSENATKQQEGDVSKEEPSKEPPKKKTKVSDEKTSTMKALQEKIDGLEKRLQKKEADDEMSEFDRAKRDVKEEAGKQKVDIDLLHEKLIVFESIARKQDHELKDKISLILSRFHIHKNRPNFASALVLKLVCSKEEEAVLDKEQKLMKSFGFQDKHDNTMTYSFGQGLVSQGGPMNSPYVMPPRFPGSPRHPRFRPRWGGPLCFKCKKPGHLVRDCPN